MPLTAVNRALLPPVFWSNYQSELQEACAKTGAYYLDLSADSNFNQTDFVDTVHLNASGGRKLVERLAQTVADVPSLNAAIAKPTKRALARKKPKAIPM